MQENLYNGDGQRIRKTEGAKATSYFYQDGVVSYTTEGSADTKALQNLLGLEENVIAAEQSTKAAEAEGDSLVYHLYNKDIQGSTTSILDESGAGEISYEYEDFGETEVHGSEAFKNEICYTGGIYDATTGHYYLNARYYDPETGRFLTEDTYRGELEEPDTLHLYAYCKNNPINYVDPSGHIVVSATLLSYAGYLLITASGLILYYSWLYRVRGKTFYVYRSRSHKIKRYKAKTVASRKTGKIVGTRTKASVNKAVSYSKSKAKSGTKGKKEAKKSQKERSTDYPSWADGTKPVGGESGKEYTKRKMDEHYGKGKWKRKGDQAREYNQLKKWGDRGGHKK